MAIKEVKRYWESCQLDYVKEFLCHTEKDVEQLPACCVGSKAYVNETGNWYACGKDQVWKLEEEATEEGGGNTGGGGGSFAQTYTDMTPGYVSVKTGAFGTGGNWQRTDYIPVSSGDVVTFSGRIGDSMGVAGYDENKAFVASVLDRINLEGGYTYENEPLTIPDGVKYIAGCTISGAYPITVMVYKDAKALTETVLPQPFVVTFSTSDMSTFTSDKTLEEINAVVESGERIVARLSAFGTYLYLNLVSCVAENLARFNVVQIDVSGGLSIIQIDVSADGTVSGVTGA